MKNADDRLIKSSYYATRKSFYDRQQCDNCGYTWRVRTKYLTEKLDFTLTDIEQNSLNDILCKYKPTDVRYHGWFDVGYVYTTIGQVYSDFADALSSKCSNATLSKQSENDIRIK